MNAITQHGDWRVGQLRRAIARAGDLWTVADLAELARAGKIQIWGDPRAVIVTELVDFPRKRVLRVFLVAGRLAGVRALAREVEHFAILHGVDLMTAEGREAWGRIGAPMGWQPRAVAYVKKLEKREAGHA